MFYDTFATLFATEFNQKCRKRLFDVFVGINLLREGLDIPSLKEEPTPYLTRQEIAAKIAEYEVEMKRAAKEMRFEERCPLSRSMAPLPSFRTFRRHPLLIEKKWARIFIRLIDALLPRCGGKNPPENPKYILVCNLAHLGDVVIATSVLPLLQKRFPEAKIGFLCASASRVVLENHPAIDAIHTLDHWKLNRSPLPLWKKVLRFLSSRRWALKEIKAKNYDLAIDLYPYFPNAIPLLWKGSIPCRIGYTSGGFGPLLTHPHAWKEKKQAMLQHHLELLKILGIEEREVFPSLPFTQRDRQEYLLFHIGSGSAAKEWPVAKWRALTELCIDKGFEIFFSGQGKREREQIEKIIHGLPHTKNMCDQLSWGQWVDLIAQARLLVSVDSAAGHIASSSKTPNVIIFSTPNEKELWTPVNPHAMAVVQDGQDVVFCIFHLLSCPYGSCSEKSCSEN